MNDVEAKQTVLEYVRDNDKGRGVNSSTILGLFDNSIPEIDTVFRELVKDGLLKDTGFGTMVRLSDLAIQILKKRGYVKLVEDRQKQTKVAEELKEIDIEKKRIDLALSKKNLNNYVNPKVTLALSIIATIISIFALVINYLKK